MFKTELAIGITSIIITGAGQLLAQSLDAEATSSITAIITQFGGLGIAVWLVYYHTTSTIPALQREFREEREKLAILHKDELDEKRQDFLKQLESVVQLHHTELSTQRAEFARIMEVNKCRYRQNDQQ